RKFPQETARVKYSLGAIYESRQNWAKVADHYKDFLRNYRRTGLPQQIVQANVAIGKAHWKKDDRKGAEEHFRAAARAGDQAAAMIGRVKLDDAERARYLFESKSATSEALFYLAEYEYAAFGKIKFPAYHGGRNLKKVNQWAQTDFRPWVEKKRKALQA